jgi:septum formation protein
MLLDQAQIPYVLIPQDADESVCKLSDNLQERVTAIALQKMEHVILPPIQNGAYCFVLTADTLSQDSQGRITGKPENKEDAIAMIKAARAGMYTGTTFCLDRRIGKQDEWCVDERIIEFAAADYVFDIPDQWIEDYCEKSIALNASGAIAIEEYGMQFLKSINGSYSGLVGLPMYELRQALEKLGFFSHITM